MVSISSLSVFSAADSIVFRYKLEFGRHVNTLLTREKVNGIYVTANTIVYMPKLILANLGVNCRQVSCKSRAQN